MYAIMIKNPHDDEFSMFEERYLSKDSAIYEINLWVKESPESVGFVPYQTEYKIVEIVAETIKGTGCIGGYKWDTKES